MADIKIDLNPNRKPLTPDSEPLFNPKGTFNNSLFNVQSSFLWDELSMQHLPKGCLDVWLQCAKEDFLSIYEGIYGLCFRSINPEALAKMEIRELDKFFECGTCLSMAVNNYKHYFRNSDPLFKVELSSADIFEHYLMLIRGDYDVLLKKGHLDILKFGEVNIEPQKIEGKTELEWWATARVQALMWSRTYLDSLVKEGEVRRVFTGGEPQGFQVTNKEIVPTLYNVLTEQILIKQISEEDFKKAFLNSQGSIDWLGIQSQLGYFIQELKNKGIVITYNNWKTAEEIFLVKGKNINAGNIKSGASQITARPKELIDSIIQKILSIDLQ